MISSEKPLKVPYKIQFDSAFKQQFIECQTCGKRSFNHRDINELYCANCHIWHERVSFKEIPSPELPSIPCQFCNLSAIKEQDSEFYICANLHKNKIYGISELPSEKKKEKKKRAITLNCKYCGKVAEVSEESKVFGQLFRKYTCGCSEFLPITTPPLNRDSKWASFLPFQQTGIEFIENANYTGAINDMMGLGKTIQALGTLRYSYSELTPCLFIVEAAKVYDWKQEFELWVGDRFNDIPDEPIIHDKGAYGLCPGFKNHIISMSLLNKPKVLESIKNYGFKMVIVDESHSFKNEDADRTFALQAICKDIPNKIFLSGTPVINRVDEFFTTLNILRPSHFPSKHSLISKCDRTPDGKKILGISEIYRDRFFKMTSEYIIRRTKKEVGIQLPDLRISKLPLDVNKDAILVKQYNKNIDELELALAHLKSSISSQSEILGIMAKLRHITGIMKVKPVIAYVREFMESTDPDAKISIGCHHKDVMEYLRIGLEEYNPICISDEDGLVKAKRIEEFKKPENRLAILSILGAGQGLNIQFCKNAILAERQWNLAREDQFIGRFHRIVKDSEGNIQTSFTEDEAVIIDVINAKDTIDEFMNDLVELKGKIVLSADVNEDNIPLEFMLELAEKLVKSRMKVGI